MTRKRNERISPTPEIIGPSDFMIVRKILDFAGVVIDRVLLGKNNEPI